MFKKLLTAVGGNPTERDLEEYEIVADAISALEPEYQALTDSDLCHKTDFFREHLSSAISGITDEEAIADAEAIALDDILVPAFATVREAAVRTIGLRHYPVQLIGGQVLHAGRIAEMRTGEGKTLVATLPLYLNALLGRGSHLVTVNDYLARRDAKWMGPIFHLLGMRVGILQDAGRTDNAQMAFVFDPEHETSQEDSNRMRIVPRREAYDADITYGTNNEFGFDYLRDNIANRLDERRQGMLHYAIIDEVDNVLIDSARTPLIISGPAQHDPTMYAELAQVVRQLKPNHYDIDDRARGISITDEGYDRVEELLGRMLRDPDRPEDITPEQAQIQSHLEQAMRAEFIFKRNKDYLVRSGHVVIVDDFTGRVMPGRRWSDGLHQAVEAKEGVDIQAENATYATITLQNFFRMYTKLSGMSGTALTEAEEFDKIYKIDVVAIPTHLDYRARVDPDLTEVAFRENGSRFTFIAHVNDPDIPLLHRRKDYDDLVFRTEEAKLRALMREVLTRHVRGQPMLIGTTSVEASEQLASRFRGDALRMLALVWILRDTWFEANDREEDGRVVPELALFNMSLQKLKTSQLRPLAKELKLRLNPNSAENISRLGDILGIESQLHSKLSKVLQSGISCQVLNAKKHDEESQIIASAGELGAVTIATNMAGRGVDIKLGGEITEEALANVNRVLKRTGSSDPFSMNHEERAEAISALSSDDYGIYEEEVRAFLQYIDDEQKVRGLGGLHVVGSERHEARRIDNQLRGRASRQGDPGSSRFYLSLEDELMRRFGGANVSNLMERLSIDEAMPIEHGIVNKSIEQSQTRVEGANFDVRKHLLEYDDVLNVQRNKFYQQRNRIFRKDDLSEDIEAILVAEVRRRVTASSADEEGHWRLLAWLDSTQPTLQHPDGSLFFPFSIELILDSLAQAVPALGNLWQVQHHAGDVEDCARALSGQQTEIRTTLLQMARSAADLALERMLLSYDAELNTLAAQLPERIRERCELAEMTYEGAVMDAREAGHALPVTQVAREMLDTAGVSLQLGREELQELNMDNLQDKVKTLIESVLGIELVSGAMRRIETRTRLELLLDLPAWDQFDWDDWHDNVLEILAIEQNVRIEKHIGEIEYFLEQNVTHSADMTRSDWGRLILDLAYSRDVSFHEKTRERVVRMEQRFPYVYHSAELVHRDDDETLSKHVLDHLTRASEVLKHSWGETELQRLHLQRLDDLDEKHATMLRARIGRTEYEAIKGQQLSVLSGKVREEVREALGRGVVIGAYRQILLSISSQLWVDYLTSMEALRTSVGLEAYAQRDPLIAYKSRAFDLFQQLILDMRNGLVACMFTSGPGELTGVRTDRPQDESKSGGTDLGRNDPCWCGSGKKFKSCHMGHSGDKTARSVRHPSRNTKKKKRKKRRARR